jgi:adenosylcobinamide amidohydrolase
MSEVELFSGIVLRRLQGVIHVASRWRLDCLSSAVVGGGSARVSHILNVGVASDYRCNDPAADLRRIADSMGIHEPFVGLLTAARISDVQVVVARAGAVSAAAIVTLGLSHPTAAGVSLAAVSPNVGTINTVVIVAGRLSPAAFVNLIVTATEAKSLVLAEHQVRTRDGHLASGTGSDALVVAHTGEGPFCEYGGPVSLVGALVGQVVRTATQAALALWQARQTERR